MRRRGGTRIHTGTAVAEPCAPKLLHDALRERERREGVRSEGATAMEGRNHRSPPPPAFPALDPAGSSLVHIRVQAQRCWCDATGSRAGPWNTALDKPAGEQ